MAKKEIEFDMKVGKFTFTKDYCFRGGFKTPYFQKVRFSYYIDERKISRKLINDREREISFRFTLTMLPDLGEISFNGKCILESPQQQKIDIVLQEVPGAIERFVDGIIRNASLKHTEEIARKNGIPIPPADVLIQMFRRKI
ncbi:MAG: hypothetical protein ACTSUK_03670 [Promethearchaeota archaeon]